MSGPAVRAMRWWDIEALMPLERDLFGDDGWSAGMFWSELAQADSRWYVVARDGGTTVGYAGLAVLPDEAYVQTVAVRRDRQRRGLGRRLLGLLLAEAERRGATTVGLEVRADNASAQRLYRAHGFEVVAVRRGYYQPSGTDAVVMQHRRVRAGAS